MLRLSNAVISDKQILFEINLKLYGLESLMKICLKSSLIDTGTVLGLKILRFG